MIERYKNCDNDTKLVFKYLALATILLVCAVILLLSVADKYRDLYKQCQHDVDTDASPEKM